MSFRMMLSMLRRHPMMPLLVWVQVALACAILCNVLFLTWRQLQPIVTPTGIEAKNLIVVDQLTRAHGEWSAADVRAGAQAIREVLGVRAASAAMGLPMVGASQVFSALQGPTGAKVGVDAVLGYGITDTLGVDLVDGRTFRPDEYRLFDMQNLLHPGRVVPIIITQALAHRLFGSAGALGGLLRHAGNKIHVDYRVVGIARHLMGSQVGRADQGRADDTVIFPYRIGKTPFLLYAVRVAPDMRRTALLGVRRAVRRKFGELLPVGSTPLIQFYGALRSQAFAGRWGALWLLAGVAAAVLIVTVFGIMGLTGFWIQKRTRTIGILRALGARRVDVVTYFQLENAVIVTLAAIAGMLLAYAGNLMLMRYYALPRLPFGYLPVGVIVMFVIGQLAALAPSLRASRVAPVVATKSI